jgi:hypothetical protein
LYYFRPNCSSIYFITASRYGGQSFTPQHEIVKKCKKKKKKKEKCNLKRIKGIKFSGFSSSVQGINIRIYKPKTGEYLVTYNIMQ